MRRKKMKAIQFLWNFFHKFLLSVRKEMNVNEIWQLYIGSKNWFSIAVSFAHGTSIQHAGDTWKCIKKEYNRIDVLF